MAGLSNRKRSCAFWILNILRVFNILSLLTGIAASWGGLAKSFVATQFFFFDGITHFFFSMICVFLVASEITSEDKFRYFAKNWPLFSNQHSLVTLGITQMFVGFYFLGSLNESFAKKEKLGKILYIMLHVSGITVVVMGILSIFLSFIFRQKQQVGDDGCETHEKITPRKLRKWEMHKATDFEKNSSKLSDYDKHSFSQRSFPTAPPQAHMADGYESRGSYDMPRYPQQQFAAAPFNAEEKAPSVYSENPRGEMARQLTSASQRPKMTMMEKMAEAQRIRALRSDSQVFREARMDDGYKPRPPSVDSSIYARTTTNTAYGAYGNKYPHPNAYDELKA